MALALLNGEGGDVTVLPPAPPPPVATPAPLPPTMEPAQPNLFPSRPGVQLGPGEALPPNVPATPVPTFGPSPSEPPTTGEQPNVFIVRPGVQLGPGEALPPGTPLPPVPNFSPPTKKTTDATTATAAGPDAGDGTRTILSADNTGTSDPNDHRAGAAQAWSGFQRFFSAYAPAKIHDLNNARLALPKVG